MKFCLLESFHHYCLKKGLDITFFPIKISILADKMQKNEDLSKKSYTYFIADIFLFATEI